MAKLRLVPEELRTILAQSYVLTVPGSGGADAAMYEAKAAGWNAVHPDIPPSI